MHMSEIGVVLLLRDQARCERFQAALARSGCTVLRADQTLHAPCDLIVADQLDLSLLPEPLRVAQSRGDIGLVQIGRACGGDVLLPVDCSSRELALACHLLAEIVRLRRAQRQQREARRTWQRLAHRDPLTDLPNRRTWNRELIRFSESKDSRHSVVILDIDNFKQLNDELGHPVGDTALLAVADELRSSVRRGDLAARIGGDEFGVLITDVDATAVESIVQRIRCAAGEAATKAVGRRVSLSAGFSQLTSGAAAAAIEAADAALRCAKSEGRDTTRQAVRRNSA